MEEHSNLFHEMQGRAPPEERDRAQTATGDRSEIGGRVHGSVLVYGVEARRCE